jgi:hypothetical protein
MSKKKVHDLDADTRFTPPDEEAMKVFDSFWKDLVCDSAGRLNRNAIIKELADYSFIISNTTKVFYEITDGRISKPNTHASAVIGVAEEVNQEIWDREIEALEQEFADSLAAEKAVWEYERFSLREEVERLRAQLAQVLPPKPGEAIVDAEFTELPVGAVPEVEIELTSADIIILYPEEV